MASRLTQSLSFHQSPESFITDRLQKLNFGELRRETAPIVRAEILNRNVHIISSYRLCKAILCDFGAPGLLNKSDGALGTVTAGPAYEQLMAAFFPRPNILLEDGPAHFRDKAIWQDLFRQHIVEDSTTLVREVTLQSFAKPLLNFDDNHQIDLYETMKKLVWDILFSIFLDLSREDEKENFDRMQRLQETLLVGQFSLFPVSVRTPFWTSARSRGLKAVQDLGPAIRDRLRSQKEQGSKPYKARLGCPFIESTTGSGIGENSPPLSEDQIVNHLRLFTSSIANKALASLLTAFIINLFIWRDPNSVDDEASLANLVSAQSDPAIRRLMLHSVLKETERLSPPVIGIMRRATKTATLDAPLGAEHTIPAGHDAWLYFVAANRDPEVFEQADTFQWDRFMGQSDETDSEGGIAFGLGAKRCLGADLSHQICLTVAETIMDSGVSFRGRINEEGVRGWLGWQNNSSVDAVARDVKQLPCQRPRKPVMLTLQAKLKT